MKLRFNKFVFATLLFAGIAKGQSLGELMKSQQNKNEEEPKTTILSDSLQYNNNTKATVFSGNVILQRGSMKLLADELRVSEKPDGTQTGTAIVNGDRKVELYNERLDLYELLKGTSKTAIYDGKTERVFLRGDAVITRSICGTVVDSIRGEEIIFDNAKSTYRANRSKTDRVRSVLQPRSKEDKAVEECRKKYNSKPMPSTLNIKDDSN
ncbi:lipopolysaccharide transport periplasmic protein LptA [Taylorella equigenitalis]|uniref:lipopolysaccharide transport periplasmic protein LptA n=1 Tax=Taylorella equigenitalis TaxID=29575 RepID=UPI00237C8588|nr:lipopolysaccharide transport periplasmic protein LptA [Taylorella equigenitalis]WDU55081.1 lipopolysaccharide transport periplasmic protein LptA [Taylorella equigenitalis]